MEINEINGYDMECVVYLACIILRELEKEKDFMYIDEYYEEILKIYEEYKKEDNPNKSLLDSINDFINKHIEDIKSRLNYVFEQCY